MTFKACNDAIPVNGSYPVGLADKVHSQCGFFSYVFIQIHTYIYIFINAFHHTFRADHSSAAVAGGHMVNYKK